MAHGNDRVKYFDRDVSPFVGLKEYSADNFATLYNLIAHTAPLLIISPTEMDIPAPWNQVRCIHGIQMVCEAPPRVNVPVNLVTLTAADVPQMLELTKLTNPGPFGSRTFEFGHYEGIFEGDRLAAMAGQRFHIFDYAEISAVCTHPGHTGKGYAKQLLQSQISRIRAVNEKPFLHVRHDNDRAISVYQSLGFVKRSDIYFYLITKNGAA